MSATPKHPPMSEAALQKAVVDCAHRHGWLVMGVRTAKVETKQGWRHLTAWIADGKGWPDLFMVRGGQALAVELKVGANRPSAEQVAWRKALTAAGIRVELWWDDDWFRGRIEEALHG